MRLHSVIYAAASGTRCVGLVYDPKVQSFMKYIGLDSCIDIEGLTGSGLISVTSDALEKPAADTEKFRKFAFSNAETVLKLLDN